MIHKFIKTTITEFLTQQKVNEISSNTFKSAINISKERGTDRRTYKLGQSYFNQFIGKSFDGGKIIDIGVNSPSQSNYRNVAIQVEFEYPNATVVPDPLKYDFIYYDIDKDVWSIDREIERKDAVMLSNIAKHINPDTKYKEWQSGPLFNIKGW